MKNRKERKHKIKQADTLETSKKTLQKATLGALRNGGFLFARNPDGFLAPVIVNARIADIATSVIPFAVSRACHKSELQDLKAYFISVLERACKLREIDISEMEAESAGKAAELAAVIAEAEGKGSPGTEDGGKCPDGSSEG